MNEQVHCNSVKPATCILSAESYSVPTVIVTANIMGNWPTNFINDCLFLCSIIISSKLR